jgi:hypothetical protein
LEFSVRQSMVPICAEHVGVGGFSCPAGLGSVEASDAEWHGHHRGGGERSRRPRRP